MDSHKKRLLQLKKKFYPKTILDIGAHEGKWSLMAKDIFPESKFFMIEANKDKYEILKKTSIPFEIVLLGNQDNIYVDYYKTNYIFDTGNSIYRENTEYFNNTNSYVVKLPMMTLESIINKYNIKNIDFIKMDVQGSELNILKGCLKLLNTVKYILIETQLVNYNEKSPKFNEVFKFMYKHGYVIYDIFEIHYNKLSKIQEIDFLFIKDKLLHNENILWNDNISTINQLYSSFS